MEKVLMISIYYEKIKIKQVKSKLGRPRSVEL